MTDDIIKILLIEDNPGDAQLIFEYLDNSNRPYDIAHQRSLKSGLEVLEENHYDVILLDLGLPDSAGLSSLDRIFQVTSAIPIIILTGFEDEQSALKAVQMGAQDYLIKGQIDSFLLSRAIRYAIERKKVSEKLKESEDHYRSLFEMNYSAMMLIDSETGAINDVNTAACDFYGYSREEFLDMNIAQINLTPVDTLPERLREAYNRSRSCFQFSHKLKNGMVRDVEVYTGPINKADKKLLYSIVHNITERKTMEEKISRINEQLEQKVKERTEEIQLLYTITQAISQTESFDEAMSVALQKICQTTGWTIGEVWIPDEEGRHLIFRTAYGSNDENIRNFIEESKSCRFTSGKGLPGFAWFKGEPVWVKDVSESKVFLRASSARQAGLKASMAFPIFTDKEIVAVFNFFTLEAREENEHYRMLISAIASQLGSVIFRKMAEEKIKQSEEQHRSLFENMSEGLTYCQVIFEDGLPKDFIYLNVNQAFEKLTGVRNVIGKRASEAIPGIRELDHELIERYGSVALTGKSQQFEIYLKSLGGWFSFSVYSPEKGFIIAVFDVITQRKQRDEEIRIERQRLRSIIKISQISSFSLNELFDYAISESIALSSSEIGFLYYYSEEEKKFTLHSWSKDTVKACHLSDPYTVCHLENTGLWAEAVRQRRAIVVNDYSAPNEFKKGLPEGHARLNRFMTVPVFHNGKIVAVAGVANKKSQYTDFDLQQLTLIMTAIWEIGEHKKVESELEKYRMHLEQKIEERTLALKETNSLLQEEIYKQKEAEVKVKAALAKEKELNELKSRFVSMISHEYRTPLTAILSSTELLELYGYRWSEEKKIDHLNKIKNSVSYMTEMLKDVLLINRAEAGRLEFNPDQLELEGFCRNLASEMQLIAGQKCKIQFSSGSEEVNAFMDKKLLHYIFNNLLANAVNYSYDGGEIKFRLNVEGGRARFTISDNGIGIPEEDKPRLFEQFYRGKNTINIPGTGLGLSIVKRCIDMHYGNISFQSTPGEGTTFFVDLPLITNNGLN